MNIKQQIVAISLFLIAFSSCMTLQNPTFQGVENVKVNQVSGNNISVDISFKVFNPNSIGFTIADAGVDATINGNKVGNIILDDNAYLKANTTSTGKVTVTLPYSTISNYLPQIFMGQSLDLKLAGDVKVRKFLFSKKFKFELNHKLKPSDIKI